MEEIKSIKLLLNNEEIRNDECPICYEEFKANDQITVGCEAKHLHHKKCFDDLVKKNNFTCAYCRKSANLIKSRIFKPCSCCDNDLTENDIKLKKQCYNLPLVCCIFNFRICPKFPYYCCLCLFTKQEEIITANSIQTSKDSDMTCCFCSKKFEINDNIVYTCEEKHLHHKECLDKMLKDERVKCNICKNLADITNVRKFHLCCISSDRPENDDTRTLCSTIPLVFCVGNCLCPFYYIYRMTQMICTKEIILENNETTIINTTLTESKL
jgi:hypothetical protein